MKKTRNNTVKRIIASALSAVSVAAYSIPAGTGFIAAKTVLTASAECNTMECIFCSGPVRNNTAGIINIYYEGRENPFELSPGEESYLNGEIIKIASDDELVFPSEWDGISDVTSKVFRNNRYVYTFETGEYNTKEYHFSDVAAFRSTKAAFDNGDGTHSSGVAHSMAGASDCTISVKSSGANKFVYNEANGFWINDNRQKDSTEAVTSWSVSVPSGKDLYLQFLLSSEERVDKLNIKLDGTDVYVGKAMGSGGFVRIPSGNHTLTASYTKDESDAEGYDSAYLRFTDHCTDCGFSDAKNIVLLESGITNYTFVGAEKNEDTFYGEAQEGYWTGRNFTIYSNTLLSIIDKATQRERPEGVTVKREYLYDDFTFNGVPYKYKMEVDIDPEISGIYEIQTDEAQLQIIPKKDFYYDGVIEQSDFELKLADCYNEEEQEFFADMCGRNPKIYYYVDNSLSSTRTVEFRFQIYRFSGARKQHFFDIGLSDELYGITEVNIKEREVAVTPEVHNISYGEAAYPITYSLEAQNGERGVLDKDTDIYSTGFEVDHIVYVNENGTKFEGNNPEPGVYKPRWEGSSYMGTYHFSLAENAPSITVYKKSEVSAASATIKAVSVTFGGSLGLNYYVELSDTLKKDTAAYAEYNIDGVTKRQFISDTSVSDGQNKFTCPIYATQVDDNINFRIVSGTGELYALLSSKGADLTSSGFNYSVGQYFEATKSSSNEKMAALSAASIDYGAAVKNYFDKNANKTVSSDVTAVSTDVFEAYRASQAGTKPAGVDGISLSVVFADDNSLRLYYNYAEGADPYKYRYYIGDTEADLRKSGTEYYLEVKNISSNMLDKEHTFSVTDGTDTYTVTASVLSYARAFANMDDTNKQTLAKAIYLYNQKAIAYAAK